MHNWLFIIYKILRVILLVLCVYLIYSVRVVQAQETFIFVMVLKFVIILSFFSPFTNQEEDHFHNYIARFQYVVPTFTQNMTMGQFVKSSMIHFFIWETRVMLSTLYFFRWILWSLTFLAAREEFMKEGWEMGRST